MDETEESVALILASHEDVISHGHVLYGLVRQGQEPNTVESTSRMVNVVPTKRIYCMESVDELVEFRKELLKRPLVLQPIIQAGTGIQSLDCFFCVKKESWVLMVNQFHSKIMEKISAGMDLAARAMFRGEGFVLVFSFGDILKKHYYGNIAKHVSSSFAYTDCEFGDVIIRSSPNKSTSKKVAQLKVSFEDVVASEIKVRTLEEAAQEKRSPVLEFIPISQLAEILPRWVFDEVEVEESIVSTSDYHSDTNIGATGGDVITTQPRHQRSSAHNRPNKHFIAVDLHTPQEPFQSIPEEDPSQDSDCDYEVGRYFHYHQGSGRSDSSVADSGYEDTGYQEKTRVQGRSNRKQVYCPENNRHIQNDRPQVHEKKNRNKQYLHVGNLRKNYDNLAYSSDEDIRGSHYDDIRSSNYYEPEVDVIVTRTGKQTFKSLDKESLTARMMDESVM